MIGITGMRTLTGWGVTSRVKSMVTPHCSPIKLEVAQEGTAETARGGLMLRFEVPTAKRILVGLPRNDASPVQGWSDAQMILAVLVLDVAGFDQASDIEHLEADAGLCPMLGRVESKPLGMAQRPLVEHCFPSTRSLREELSAQTRPPRPVPRRCRRPGAPPPRAPRSTPNRPNPVRLRRRVYLERGEGRFGLRLADHGNRAPPPDLSSTAGRACPCGQGCATPTTACD